VDDTTRDAIQAVLDRQIMQISEMHGEMLRMHVAGDVAVAVFKDGRWAWINAEEDDGCVQITVVTLTHIDDYAVEILRRAGAIDIETRTIIARHWGDKDRTATLKRERERLAELIRAYPEDARRILSDSETEDNRG